MVSRFVPYGLMEKRPMPRCNSSTVWPAGTCRIDATSNSDWAGDTAWAGQRLGITMTATPRNAVYPTVSHRRREVSFFEIRTVMANIIPPARNPTGETGREAARRPIDGYQNLLDCRWVKF